MDLDCLSKAVKKRGVASSLFTLGADMPCFAFGLLPEAQIDLLSQGVFSFPDFISLLCTAPVSFSPCVCFQRIEIVPKVKLLSALREGAERPHSSGGEMLLLNHLTNLQEGKQISLWAGSGFGPFSCVWLLCAAEIL